MLVDLRFGWSFDVLHGEDHDSTGSFSPCVLLLHNVRQEVFPC